MIRKSLLVAFPLILAIGCVKNNALPPGALNAFDANAYNTLITAQAAINQAKAEFASNPSAKAPLNASITAYNTALAAYISYHNGGGTSASAVQAGIDAMLSAISALNQKFGQTAKPAASMKYPPVSIELIEVGGN